MHYAKDFFGLSVNCFEIVTNVDASDKAF